MIIKNRTGSEVRSPRSFCSFVASNFKAALLTLILGTWTILGLAQSQIFLRDLFTQANTYYPTLQAARLEKRASMEDLEASRRLYWPNVSATAENTSSTAYASTTALSRSLQIEQTLWDAGQVKSKVAESKSQADIQELKAALVQEDLYLQITNAWQNLLASRERMSVSQQAISRLQGYQIQMQRRVKAEASPRIDLELANSRILQTQVEYQQAKNTFSQALTRIEQYTGRNDLKALMAKSDAVIAIVPPLVFESELSQINLEQWIWQHPAIAKAKAETAQSQSRLDQKQSETWPQIYARVSQPLSNSLPGYPTGPAAFLGVRYSSSAGFSNHLQAQALATRVASAEELVNAVANELRQSLQVDQDEYFNAKSRLRSLELAVQGSDLVLDSYQRQFQGGKKTWQDLLNAVRELAQNQYALADARASMLGAAYRVQIRAGLEIQ